jgi:hypothetical protein
MFELSKAARALEGVGGAINKFTSKTAIVVVANSVLLLLPRLCSVE